MKAKLLVSAVAATLMMTASLASAGTIVYASGTFNPWGNTSNDTAMDSAFGAGSWTRVNAYTVGMFTGADFVFLDGSDSNANEFSSFLAANQSVVANYVSNGGHLFLNSAPNEGGSYDMGFGVTLNYVAYSGVANVTAAGVAAGLTAGGLTTGYTGSYFSHGAVSGGGISDLINGDAGTIFGAKNVDAGFVAFGGQTTANFHGPSADAAALLVNELRYVANAPDNRNEVPEPTSLALFGLGMAGVAALRRRKSTN
jgi:hypothetical protein